MKKIVFFLFIPYLGISQIQIGSNINGEAANDQSGYSVSLSSDGSIVAIGAWGNDENGAESGHVRVYKNIAGVWTQIGSDIDGEAAGDASGWSISLSGDGNILAIGAPNNDGNGNLSGHVKVYQNISDVWTQIGFDIDGEAAGDLSGSVVSLSRDGSVVAICAYWNDGNGFNAGHTRVYKNISGQWTQMGLDIDNEATGDGSSGMSVSLSNDGNIVAIGAVYNNGNGDNSGHVRIYQNISGAWIQTGTDIDGEAILDYSGSSVALSDDGSIVAIGAYGNDANGLNSGHVRVYQNVSGVWTQIGSDIDGETANEFSGYSLSLSSDGNILAIGAYGYSGVGSYFGRVRVYKNNSGTWTRIGTNIDGLAAGDFFGRSVSLSSDGSFLAIGADKNDENGTDSGQVRIFDLTAVLATEDYSQVSFSLYPNPANDILHIALNNNSNLEKVCIYDVLGKLVKMDTSKTIRINNLAKGMYFLEVLTNQGKGTKKVIIK